MRREVPFYLEDSLRRSAQAGSHNFIRLMSEVLEEDGFAPTFRSMKDRFEAGGKAMTHMKAPQSSEGLIFRRVYHYPFWQIEQTDKRWNWDIARALFDPTEIPEKEANRFRSFWQKRLFEDLEQQKGDAIYVPLQGRILQKRSFQSCSPLIMVQSVLENTDRPVVVTLQPKETYNESEILALKQLIEQHDHAALEVGQMTAHLPKCHMIVTQNSSAAFNGFFFDKPVVLFAKIDFHHIARTASLTNLSDALEAPPRASEEVSKYIWWFWQNQSINAGRPEAKTKIRARLARFGWLS